MSLVLYGHPFSSYTQKALIALYENGTPFEFRCIAPDAPQHMAEWLRRWPLRKFPLLLDGERSLVETSIVIEYLQLAHPGPVRLLPMKRGEGLAIARERLDLAYTWLEGHLAGRTWAAGADFSLADCAAAPSLFYADWTHPIPASLPLLRAYRARLLARPSFARAVEEARPFRSYFPLGAPDRD
ncbi:glutathione S-transferase [Burkholderiales bacterium JOSHI_001]|nr:glutathione S-transferase [Burkholderiales bacterium JOSHI_001]